MGRFVLALAVVVLSAGCRDADSGYEEDANAVCASAVAEYRALLERAGTSRAARDEALTRMIRVRGAAVSELHELEPPTEKRAAFERMLRRFDESQLLLRSGSRSFGESEEAPFLLVFGAREGDKAQALARELGLGACAEL